MGEKLPPTEGIPKGQLERFRYQRIGIEDAHQKKRVLWIHADPVMWAYAKAVLEPTYEVILGWDGWSGLALLRQRTPHLVVLNAVLLDMETLEFLQQVVSVNPNVPLIILTGRPMPGGFFDSVRKFGVRESVDLCREHLLNVIAKTLER